MHIFRIVIQDNNNNKYIHMSKYDKKEIIQEFNELSYFPQHYKTIELYENKKRIMAR